MGRVTLAETIRQITRSHLEDNDGILLGQSISAVGWINGTVPDCKNIVELPMTDVAGAGFAVGAALVGRRPIFVLRFQDFIMLNGSALFNYAAKAGELHGVPAPVFIRSIGADCLGPVHSGVFHTLAMHYPGMLVCAPMTPQEYEEIWAAYMDDTKTMYVSEHRRGYGITDPLPDEVFVDAEITIYGISDARLNVMEAAATLRAEGIIANIIHINWLKPLQKEKLMPPLIATEKGLVVDSGFEICGAARSIAYELSEATGLFVHALACKDFTKCLSEPNRNATPSSRDICSKVRQIMSGKGQ
jgi:pyruvate dehydrogenase E1 component beta subunit